MNDDPVRLSGTMPVDLVINVRTRSIERVDLGDERFEVSDRPAITYDFRSTADASRDKLARAIAADPSVEWPVIETA